MADPLGDVRLDCKEPFALQEYNHRLVLLLVFAKTRYRLG